MIKPDKLNLKQWAVEDRPREKMKQKGAKALTNAELLAILIHTGNTEDSVVALTQKVMASCRNSLSELGKLSVGELCSFKGIGEAKAITILAACELGRRRKEEEPVSKPVIRTSRDVYDYFYTEMVDLQVKLDEASNAEEDTSTNDYEQQYKNYSDLFRDYLYNF